jgi:hypothetical protein
MGTSGWQRRETQRIHAAAGGDQQLLELLAWAAVMSREEPEGELLDHLLLDVRTTPTSDKP